MLADPDVLREREIDANAEHLRVDSFEARQLVANGTHLRRATARERCRIEREDHGLVSQRVREGEALDVVVRAAAGAGHGEIGSVVANSYHGGGEAAVVLIRSSLVDTSHSVGDAPPINGLGATSICTMVVEHRDVRYELLGHASFRLETREGTVVYVDPWSDVIDGHPADGDVVFVTHDDFDHYDPAGIEAVSSPDGVVAAYEAINLDDVDRPVIDLPHDGVSTVAGIRVRTLPAYNDPEGDHVDDDGQPYHAEGDGISLVLEIAGSTIFVPSDTDVLPHHEQVAADVLVAPIGGHYTMDRHEAADLARRIEPDLVLPVHYGTFEPIETDAEAFLQELREHGIRVELA